VAYQCGGISISEAKAAKNNQSNSEKTGSNM